VPGRRFDGDIRRGFAGIYSIRRVSFPAYLDKRVDRLLSKWSFISKLHTAGSAATGDIPPVPVQLFISQIQFDLS
jgi:hypothetical protein